VAADNLKIDNAKVKLAARVGNTPRRRMAEWE
jgi:hypothetical protein